MTRRSLIRDDRGSALISAIALIGVMLMLGLGVHAVADTQTRQSGQERVRESAFGVAEAALNAQVFQLARNFPGTAAGAAASLCGPGSGSAALCPDNGNFQGYTGGDYSTTCEGSAVTRWNTRVRDNVGALQYYNAATVNANPAWDSNGDGIVWVRADGRSGCRTRSIVTQVRLGDDLVAFPRNMVTANGLSVTNNGRKILINTQGTSGTPGGISLRCTGLTQSTCAQYDPARGQISPNTVQTFDQSPSPALSGSALTAVQDKARSLGKYYPAGTCPPNLNGEVVYVEDLTPCGGSRAGNAPPLKPGFLVVGRGTFNIGGNSLFHGVVYMRNEQNSTGNVVTITGTAGIIGAVAVDGPGRVSAGSSKMNLEYDPNAFDSVRGIAAATGVPNTWRELPAGS
jgi:Tfp pilus assembly protein PilX